MTRLVIVRLARGGELVSAGRSSLAGLHQVASTCRSRDSMTVLPLARASSVGRAVISQTPDARAPMRVGPSMPLFAAICPHAISAIPAAARSARPAGGSAKNALLCPIVWPFRFPKVGGISGPASSEAESDHCETLKGGDRHQESGSWS